MYETTATVAKTKKFVLYTDQCRDILVCHEDMPDEDTLSVHISGHSQSAYERLA